MNQPGVNENRRRFLASAFALMAASRARARGRITRARVSVITDEVGVRLQSEAVDFAKRLNISLVELRNVPETKKEFAQLTEPELRRFAAELAENKIKVSLLKTSLLKAAWPGTEPPTHDDLAAAITAASDSRHRSDSYLHWSTRKQSFLRSRLGSKKLIPLARRPRQDAACGRE